MPLEVPAPTKLYSVNEAAKVLGVSRVTLWKAIYDGKLPAVKYAKWVFVSEHDLQEWKAKHYRAEMARRRGKSRKQEEKG